MPLERAWPRGCLLLSQTLFQPFQLSVLLRNPFVQVLSLQIGKLSRKEPAIPFNVLPMAPHLGRFEVNHPPSPLWMFLSRVVDWVGKLAARCPDSLDQ
jgi:hypothetical protein